MGSSNTRFDHLGDKILTELDASNGITRRYVYGPGEDEPVVWYEGAGLTDRRWLHTDERGSVISITNGSGTVTNINSYDDHGIPGTLNTGRFQYTGQAWLPDLGMYYYKARMYSPTLGRFMQTDPIGYGDGPNWYAYAGGDPVNGSDPSGESLASILKSIGDFFGSIFGGSGGSSDSGSSGGSGSSGNGSSGNGSSGGGGGGGDSPPPSPCGGTGQSPCPTQEIVVTANKRPPRAPQEPIVISISNVPIATNFGPLSNATDIDEIVVTARKRPSKKICDTLLPNGCGAAGSSLPVPNLFPQSCNMHDTCYATPGKSKTECDSQFYNNMIAEGRYTQAALGFASIYYKAVRTKIGNNAYSSSQSLARQCR